MLIDTHAHLWWDCYAGRIEEVLARAQQAGVEKIVVPGTDVGTSKQAIELAKRYPGRLYAAVGIHPEELGDIKVQAIELMGLIEKNREVVVAVGEIGTDKYKGLAESIEAQKILFSQQLEIAREYNLPVIIHTRESLDETLEILDQQSTMPRGVFHCYSYDIDGVKTVLERGFFLSFCANVTWSKRLQTVLVEVPINRLLLETDSPFMTPIEKKPETNEPANVKITAELIARVKGITLEELAQQTSQNAKELFGI